MKNTRSEFLYVYNYAMKIRSKKNLRFAVFLILCTLSLGCTTLKLHHFVRVADRPIELSIFFRILDEAAEKTHTKVTADFSIPRFPYLRANRFLAELGRNLNSNSQKELWAESLRQLDLEARTKEINNLPEETFKEISAQLGEPADRRRLITKLKNYSQRFLDYDKAQPDFYETLKASLKYIPEEYSTLQRLIGVYPIFSAPVILGIEQAHKKFLSWHKTPVEKLKVLGAVRFFSPSQRLTLSPQEVSQVFSPGRRNALGTFQLTDAEIQKLVTTFAPVYSQDIAADYDQFGEVVWKNNKVSIDKKKPTVYYYLSYAIFKKKPVMQLNYSIWYTKRSGPNSPWLERGPLDGMTIRITLDQDGSPIVMDTINNCGCYHFFVPRQDKVQRIIFNPFRVNPLVPAWLPVSYPQQDLILRINSGWHQLQHIYTGNPPVDALPYQLLPYDVLESLPHVEGRTESVFTPQGIMKDSKRIEPFVFFSMGIPQIGLMRERGHHAISMVGKIYFTDPRLFEKFFVFK